MRMNQLSRTLSLGLAGAVALLAIPPRPLDAYPLNGFERSGIRRLLGYSALQAAATGPKLSAGALLGVDDVALHLLDPGNTFDLDAAAKDPELQAALEATFKRRDSSYAIAIADISDPEAIAWAGLREDSTQLPGSVGKILCMIGLFDQLRQLYPNPEDRLRVLSEREMVATDWALGDPHTVPKYDEKAGVNRFSVVTLGDKFRLSEWIDHMISASANSAGAMVWKEAMLMSHFGASYPPSPDAEAAFFRETPRTTLTEISLRVLEEPLEAAGIDRSKLRQGTMWTRVSQARVPGVASFASPKELVRVLLRIEQGRMVDAWSSLEMKRYLYMTKKRYRYVFAPELAPAAAYFKSGSFYQCRPEEGFSCGKYKGNAKNLMNSVAIIESPAVPGETQKRYLVALLSNVLKVNSAWDHSRIGAAIDEMIRTRSAAVVREQGSARDLQEVGKSD